MVVALRVAPPEILMIVLNRTKKIQVEINPLEFFNISIFHLMILFLAL